MFYYIAELRVQHLHHFCKMASLDLVSRLNLDKDSVSDFSFRDFSLRGFASGKVWNRLVNLSTMFELLACLDFWSPTKEYLQSWAMIFSGFLLVAWEMVLGEQSESEDDGLVALSTSYTKLSAVAWSCFALAFELDNEDGLRSRVRKDTYIHYIHMDILSGK